MSATTNDNNSNAIVQVNAAVGGLQESGSGVLIAPDLVLTAAHVISSSINGLASSVSVTLGAGTSNSTKINGEVIGYNEIPSIPLPASNGSTGSGTISLSSNLVGETLSAAQTDYALIRLDEPIANASTMSLVGDFAGGSVTVSGYPVVQLGSLVSDSQTVTEDPTYSVWVGNPVLAGMSGGPVWTTNAVGNPEVVGLVTSTSATSGYYVDLTNSDINQIEQWEASNTIATSTIPDPSVASSPPPTLFDLDDLSSGATTVPITADFYSGPLLFLSHDDSYSYFGSDDVKISALSATNPLISSGSGNDTLVGSATGSSVLDGGTGANLLIDGGNGNTTFVANGYTSGSVWDFLVNFHAGDKAVIFGYSPGISNISVLQNGGAGSYTGVTVLESPGNGNSEAVTFVGASASLIHGAATTIDGIPSFVLWSS